MRDRFSDSRGAHRRFLDRGANKRGGNAIAFLAISIRTLRIKIWQ
jgi:hypothetical protein